MNYKKIIDEFIVKKYDYLIECSTNVLKGKNNPHDLVSELVLFFYDNQEKLELFISQDSYLNYSDTQMLEGFSVSWLRIQGGYKTSTFNRKWKRNDNSINIPEIAEEPTYDEENEYIKDLRRVYTEDQITNILKIHDIYPTLTKVEQMLFNAYFLEGLSYEKIKNKYNFYRTKNGKKVFYKSKKSIYNLMNELKITIKRSI
jgi:hypothetical protein